MTQASSGPHGMMAADTLQPAESPFAGVVCMIEPFPQHTQTHYITVHGTIV